MFTIFIQKSRHSGIVYSYMNTYPVFTVLHYVEVCGSTQAYPFTTSALSDWQCDCFYYLKVLFFFNVGDQYCCTSLLYNIDVEAAHVLNLNIIYRHG